MKRVAPLVLCLTPLAFLAPPAALAAGSAADAYREARAHLAARRYEEAAARFEAAAATTNAAAAAAAWFGRGKALYGAKRWEAAIAAYDALLKTCPEGALAPNALYSRGHAEHQAGHLERALATFTEFKRRYPDHALAAASALSINTLSLALEAQARQQSVAAVTRELAAINASVHAEKYEEARAAAERFLQAHPGHPQAADLRYLAATCAYRAKDFVRAAEGYRAFLAGHPQHARAAAAREQLAESLFRAGRFDEALLLYEALAIEADTPQAEARATLAIGDCHAAQQKWDEAERDYLSVEVLQGCDALRPVALGRLADLHEKKGQPEKARQLREERNRRYPGF